MLTSQEEPKPGVQTGRGAAGLPPPPVSLPPRAYLLVRRPEFINATLNYAAHLSPQLRGT